MIQVLIGFILNPLTACEQAPIKEGKKFRRMRNETEEFGEWSNRGVSFAG